MSVTYQFDPTRRHLHGLTGIYVRALQDDGRWGNADIIELTDESLVDFLTSRGTVAWPASTAVQLLRLLQQWADQFGISAET